MAQHGSVSLYLAYDTIDGDFCCASSYDPRSEKCQQGPKTPFSLEPGQVIFNRTDGSFLYPNTSSLLERKGGTSATTIASTTTVRATITSNASSGEHTRALVAGISVPLIVLLIAAVVVCGYLVRQLRNMKRAQSQQNAYGSHPSIMGAKQEQFSKSNGFSGFRNPSSPQQMIRYPLIPLVESDGSPVHQAPTLSGPVEADSGQKQQVMT